MSLESVYFISGTVLNIKERVENCIEGLVDEFNQNLENFEVPATPCADKLKYPFPPHEDVEFYGSMTAADVVADIKQKFDCLYYSFLAQTGNNCTTNDCDPNACRTMRFQPVFETKDKKGFGFSIYFLNPYPGFFNA
mmetsp:Transcript_14025/g.41068  ORF Transcript_14025/g.41068 Transcript_14025/m.41068 type:complete len:137 (+) Transcript_14025:1275-1685(+)